MSRVTSRFAALRRVLSFACFAVLAALVASAGLAARPGGGGGGSTTGPGGTVYFGYVGGLWSMSGNDGSGKTQLNVDGHPSRQTYGGHRWFLQTRYAEASPLGEAWLVRDDGVEQQLPLDVDLEVGLGWGPGDVLLGAGRRWMLDGNVDPDSCGVYVGGVEFDAAGGVVAYTPPEMVAPLDVVADENGQPVADISWGWSASPDLTRIVQTRASAPGLWVTDLATGASRQITTDGSAPIWSPAGGQIAYAGSAELFGSVAVVNVDGTGRKALVKATSRDWVWLGDWSPTGSHLTYTVTSKLITSNIPDEIYRINAAGGEKANLTADIGGWFGNVHWR